MRLRAGRVSFRMHRRTGPVCAGALLLSGLFLLVSPCVGAYPVTVPEVADALFHGTGDRLAVHFVNQERLPQALLAILVGCALGISGAIFQSVSRNALASPDVIGFNSGAATGAILVIVTSGGAAASVAAGAIAGGPATALVVSVLASRGGLHGIRLVLIGLGVTAMLGSVNSYLLIRSSLDDAQNAHLARRHGERAGLELGDDLATGLGVRVNRSRLALTVPGIGLCGVAVASAGPIPFMAQAAPQIAVMVSPQPRGRSAVGGGGGCRTAVGRTPRLQPVLHRPGVGRRADRLDPGGRGVPAQQPAAGGRHHGRAGRCLPGPGAVQAARHRHRVSGRPGAQRWCGIR
ncbi:FecCD family ABC transporter permease [Streptomyces cyaneofuscatus]|uniref:FecCD family ABC transporter permease n=1 Tax=Streptomyces cyaneofuscatus TaxID=66883 RepID=UPI0036529288